MALHLVTGFKGEAHITPEDVGAFNAGTFGGGDYVLDTGNKFAVEVVSNNNIKILDGDLMMQGRHITLRSGTHEELNINNGDIGVNRNDIVVVRYTKDAQTGIENAELAVVQGTATDGVAVDPELETGNLLAGNCLIHEMPLYRIPLKEYKVGEPEPLFKFANSLHKDGGLMYRGWNPLASIDEDTPEKWYELGNGFWLIDIDGRITGQPNRWGFLYNTVGGAHEVAQIFVVQASGEIYRRNANSAGWYGADWREGTWTAMYDDTLFAHITGTYSGNGEESRFVELGFTPSAVFVARSDGSTARTDWFGGLGHHYFGGLALKEHGCRYWHGNVGDVPILSVAENGFNVYESYNHFGSNDDRYTVSTNSTNTFYFYIAYR